MIPCLGVVVIFGNEYILIYALLGWELKGGIGKGGASGVCEFFANYMLGESRWPFALGMVCGWWRLCGKKDICKVGKMDI